MEIWAAGAVEMGVAEVQAVTDMAGSWVGAAAGRVQEEAEARAASPGEVAARGASVARAGLEARVAALGDRAEERAELGVGRVRY